MADILVLQEGEEPSDLENYVLVEQIPAPRGAPRYRIAAQGLNAAGPAGLQETCDSLEIAREWAARIARTWHSQPPIYVRHPLGSNENGTRTSLA